MVVKLGLRYYGKNTYGVGDFEQGVGENIWAIK
jgi:hypothetical protein